ncbi:MAG: hypothetical protein GX226_06340 [Dehalococcoidales bacterium]|nr:hypothetical protein [Dehalococcoidales bacterium]
MKKILVILISAAIILSIFTSGCVNQIAKASEQTSKSIPIIVEGGGSVAIMTTTVNTSTYTKFSSLTTSIKNAIVTPPVYSVTARTADGTGVITMVMRTFDNALGKDDIDYIKEYTESILGSVYEPENPKIVATPEGPEDAAIVAFCYVVYADRIPNSFWGTAGNEDSCENVYKMAMEWFIKELAERD